MPIYCLAFFAVFAATTHMISAQEISPPDVFAQTQLVRDELELIRLQLNRPQDTRTHIAITRAAPREVFFQALTLFKKTDRFCFEVARKRTPPPPIPTGEIQPAHVYGVVHAALIQLRQIKIHLDINDEISPQPLDPDKNPTDVLRSIVQANRQLNLLLDRQFAPSDVYQQVTRAISYAYGLRSNFPGDRMPATPAFVADKEPADVYERLLLCLEQLREITQLSGINILEYSPHQNEIRQATPSDVYDIASLVTSEIQYLHSLVGGRVYDASYPGEITPSHVYQRVGLLHAQLDDLKELIQTEPMWSAQ